MRHWCDLEGDCHLPSGPLVMPACQPQLRSGSCGMSRVGAHADAACHGAAGPSTFIPAETSSASLRDDTRIFDASGLTIHQAADDEVGGRWGAPLRGRPGPHAESDRARLCTSACAATVSTS